MTPEGEGLLLAAQAKLRAAELLLTAGWAKARGRPDPLLKIRQEAHGNRVLFDMSQA